MNMETKNIPIPSTIFPGLRANHIASGIHTNNDISTAIPDIVNETPIFLHKNEVILSPGCIEIEVPKSNERERFKKIA